MTLKIGLYLLLAFKVSALAEALSYLTPLASALGYLTTPLVPQLLRHVTSFKEVLLAKGWIYTLCLSAALCQKG